MSRTARVIVPTYDIDDATISGRITDDVRARVLNDVEPGEQIVGIRRRLLTDCPAGLDADTFALVDFHLFEVEVA